MQLHTTLKVKITNQRIHREPTSTGFSTSKSSTKMRRLSPRPSSYGTLRNKSASGTLSSFVQRLTRAICTRGLSRRGDGKTNAATLAKRMSSSTPSSSSRSSCTMLSHPSIASIESCRTLTSWSKKLTKATANSSSLKQNYFRSIIHLWGNLPYCRSPSSESGSPKWSARFTPPWSISNSATHQPRRTNQTTQKMTKSKASMTTAST